MTLLDEARVAQAASHRGPHCRVAAIRETLDEGFRHEFDALIGSDVYTTVVVATLKHHQILLPENSINRHRAGKCLCDVAA